MGQQRTNFADVADAMLTQKQCWHRLPTLEDKAPSSAHRQAIMIFSQSFLDGCYKQALVVLLGSVFTANQFINQHLQRKSAEGLAFLSSKLNLKLSQSLHCARFRRKNIHIRYGTHQPPTITTY